MKKFLVSLVALFVSVSCFSTEVEDTIPGNIQGSWKIENIVYTFSTTEVTIDEIGNEGESYSVSYINGVVTANNQFNNITFSVKRISKNKISIKFDGEKPFVLNKINNYKF